MVKSFFDALISINVSSGISIPRLYLQQLGCKVSSVPQSAVSRTEWFPVVFRIKSQLDSLTSDPWDLQGRGGYLRVPSDEYVKQPVSVSKNSSP